MQDVVNGQNVIQVYPSPVQNQFSVYLRNFVSASAVITLFNAGGQRLYTKNITLVNGSEYIEIPSKHLPYGTYLLQITAGNNFKYVKKLLR